MKKILATMAMALAVAIPSAALAEPKPEPYTIAAMGCMKLNECTDGVVQVSSVEDLKELFGDDWVYNYNQGDVFYQELYAIFDRLNKIGIKVYIADGFNFPRTHRGSYYTDTNTFYLNKDWVKSPEVFIKVLRHEGWHAAQDCMAGGIDNTFIAVILNDETIPQRYKLDAELRYGLLQPRAIPWEQEAIWAANEPGMTADALNACASGPMWNEYEPTPMTKDWLEREGYIN